MPKKGAEIIDWATAGLHVVEELKRLSGNAVQMDKRVTDLRVEVATLKVKCGLWGGVGAAVPVTVGLLVKYLG